MILVGHEIVRYKFKDRTSHVSRLFSAHRSAHPSNPSYRRTRSAIRGSRRVFAERSIRGVGRSNERRSGGPMHAARGALGHAADVCRPLCDGQKRNGFRCVRPFVGQRANRPLDARSGTRSNGQIDIGSKRRLGAGCTRWSRRRSARAKLLPLDNERIPRRWSTTVKNIPSKRKTRLWIEISKKNRKNQQRVLRTLKWVHKRYVYTKESVRRAKPYSFGWLCFANFFYFFFTLIITSKTFPSRYAFIIYMFS